MALVAGTNASEIIGISAGTTDEADTIYGLNGDDTIFGLGGDDVIEGGLGADSMDGGGGHNTISYEASSSVIVSLIAGASNAGGDAFGDVFTNIQNIIGSGQQDILRGDDRANNIAGGGGDDSIDGRDGVGTTVVDFLILDSFSGGSGADTINCMGASGAASIHGDAGADSILGGDGGPNIYTSYLYGDDGADTILGGLSNDTINGGADADLIHGGDGNDLILDYSSDLNVLYGDIGNDTIDVTDATVGGSLVGGDGLDYLVGGGGADTITGDAGSDYVMGSAGGDSMDGGAGFDILTYAFQGAPAITLSLVTGIVSNGDHIAGFEEVFGGRLSDRLTGDDTANGLYGELGADTLLGGGADDTIDGGPGSDSLDGGSGAHDLLTYARYYHEDDAGVKVSLATGAASGGLATGDVFKNLEDLEGSQFNDTLSGDGGANLLYGQRGDDALTGSGGNDTLLGDGALEIAIIVGNDTLIGGAGSDLLDGGGGVDTASYVNSAAAVAVNLEVGTGSAGDAAGDRLTSIENLIGSSHADTLVGDSAGNTLDGGAGADSLAGGAGDDVYVLDATGERVSEASGGGTDLVRSAHTFTLGANLENLTLTGSANVSGYGNDLANALTGNSGANLLNGGEGADTMTGGAGNDTYVVDSLSDVVKEAGGGVDLVQSSHSFSLAGQALENLTLIRTGDINGTGNSYANHLIGNVGDNRLNGAAGADTMEGGAGDDTYVVDDVGDVVKEAGGGSDLVQSSVSFSLAGQSLERLTLTGSGALHGDGNSNANVIVGNGAANQLDGGLAADTLTGGAGHDYFLFDTALSSANVDKITDFSVADDTIRLDHAVFAGLTKGVLPTAQFHVGAAAADPSDRIIYDSATGKLFFDDDGSGAHAAKQFATIGAGLALTHSDFQVV